MHSMAGWMESGRLQWHRCKTQRMCYLPSASASKLLKISRAWLRVRSIGAVFCRTARAAGDGPEGAVPADVGAASCMYTYPFSDHWCAMQQQGRARAATMLTEALDGRLVLIDVRCGVGYVLHVRCGRVARSMVAGAPGAPSPGLRLHGAWIRPACIIVANSPY
jgi:hypothetical protein